MNRKIYFKLLMLFIALTYASTGWSQTPGTALQLNGTNNYVTIPHSTSLNVIGSQPITVAMWIKTPATLGSTKTFFSKQRIYSLDLNASYSFFRFNCTNVGSYNFQNVYTFNPNQWYYVAVTYNGVSTAKLYVDGTFIANGSQATAFSGYNTTADQQSLPYNIGLRNRALTSAVANDFVEYWGGAVDELKLYNTVLTDAQIQAGMFTQPLSNESGLVAYYNCNDASGNVLSDATSNANSGTLINSPAWSTSYAFVRPTAVAATAISATGFTANWLAPTNATVTSYLVDVANTVDFTNPIASSVSVTGTSYAVSGNPYTTEFYYRVRGVGEAGITTNSTVIAIDFIAPTLVNTVNSTASSTASITFTASQKALLYYSTTASTQATLTSGVAVDLTNALSTTLTISGLTPSSTNYVYAIAKDIAGNFSAVYSIPVVTTTADVTAPILSLGFTSSTTSTAALVATVNEQATVYYSLTLPVPTTGSNYINITTTGTISLSTLTAGTNYILYGIAKDVAGNISSTTQIAFATAPAPDTTPATVIFGTTTATISTATITVTLNENGKVYYSLTQSSATAILAGTYVDAQANSATSFTIPILIPNTAYTLYVVTKDVVGNTSSVSSTSFRTAAVTEITENIATQLNVYPNPASDKVTVTYVLSETTKVDAKLFNVAGIEVKSFALGTQNSGSQTISIDIANLKEGVYILKLQTKSGIVNIPVVVKH